MTTERIEKKDDAVMVDGLLPCPFDDGTPQRWHDDRRYAVLCLKCGAKSPDLSSRRLSDAAWNRRATPPSDTAADNPELTFTHRDGARLVAHRPAARCKIECPHDFATECAYGRVDTGNKKRTSLSSSKPG